MSLKSLFEAHQGRLIDKWAHYLPIYERYFAKFVGQSPRVLEIGVGHGGSLQLWKAYFGPGSSIIGVDIDPRCESYDEDDISVCILDQKDSAITDIHWDKFDIVIDDGSHELADQQASIDHLWPKLAEGGVYVIEDCHTGIFPHAPKGASSAAMYPWVVVFEKCRIEQQRIIAGHPSRPLNVNEREAYAEHLHPDV